MINSKGTFYFLGSGVARRSAMRVASALVAAMAGYASASTVFTNFGSGMSYDTSQGNPVGNDFAGDNAAEANSFILSGNAKLQSLVVPLSCVVSCQGSENFTISLAANSGGSPGAVIERFAFTGVTLGALGNNNAPIIATSVLSPLLVGGTEYWITLTSSPSFAIAWNLNSTGDTSAQASSTDGGATWFSPSGMTPSALQVNGIIPEPSAGLLLGGGLLGLVLLRRFKRAY
jgi:hypothetical protein